MAQLTDVLTSCSVMMCPELRAMAPCMFTSQHHACIAETPVIPLSCCQCTSCLTFCAMQGQQGQVAPSWVRITLQSQDGSSNYASARLAISRRPDWQRVEAVLTADATDAHAKVGFTFEGPGVLLLDVLSLFPAENYARQGAALNPWPFRADLLSMLQALQPRCMPACASFLPVLCMLIFQVITITFGLQVL